MQVSRRYAPMSSRLPPIVIIDDDPDDVFILKRLLLKADVNNKVVGFEDPLAATAYLDAQRQAGDPLYIPCMIFTDLHMPKMEGDAVVEWIRGKPGLEAVNVFVVSSSENPRDAEKCLAAGASRFFIKYPAPSVLSKLAKECLCG